MHMYIKTYLLTLSRMYEFIPCSRGATGRVPIESAPCHTAATVVTPVGVDIAGALPRATADTVSLIIAIGGIKSAF